MKKFFKALALVLALTLVIGTIPAAAADAAYSLKWTEKKIYLGEKMGFKLDADGNKVFYKGVSKVSYAKAIKGIASKDEAKEKNVTAKSTDETIVSTHNTAKKIVAEAIGEATVTYYVDGVEIGSIKYIVKKTAADTIRFGAGSETVERLHEDGKVIIGKEYNVSLPWTEEGEQVDTNKRRLTVTDKDGKAVDATKAVVTKVADKARLWTVKFLAEGDYIVLGEAYQSNAYNGATGKVSINVTAGIPEIESVKQLTMNSFEITFNGDASLTKVDSFAPENIYYKVVDNVVPFATVKSVKVDEKDNTKVTVTMGENFRDNTTYYVNFGGAEKTFVTGGSDKDSIAKFEISTLEYVINDFATIGYKFYNAKGIDITAGLLDTVIPDFEVVSSNASDVGLYGNTVLFDTVGKKVTIKGTVPGTTLTDTKEIVAVAAKKAEFDSIVYTVEPKEKADGTFTYTTANAKDLKAVKSFKINDDLKTNPDVLYVFFKYKNPDGTYSYKTLDEEEIKNVKFSNENFAMVKSIDLANSYLELAGIKEGSTNLIFYKIDANGNEQAIPGTVSIKVDAARKLSKIVLDPANSYLNTLTAASDTLTINGIAYDQYGDAWAKGGSVEAKKIKYDDKITGVAEVGTTTPIGTDGKFSFTFVPGDFTWADSLTDAKKAEGAKVQINVEGKENSWSGAVKSNTITITVADKATNTNITYVPKFSLDTLDVSKKKGTEQKTTTLTLYKKSGNFNAGTEASFKWLSKDQFANILKTPNIASGVSFVYTISKDGVVLNDFTNLGANTTTTGDKPFISVTNIQDSAAPSSGGSITVAAAGKYVFTFYKIENVDAAGKVTKFSVVATRATLNIAGTNGTSEFAVKSSSVDLSTLARGTQTETYDSAIIAAVDEAFEIKYDGDVYHPYKATVTVSTDNSMHVAKVWIKVPSTRTTGYYDVELTVGKLVNGSKK